MTIKIVKATNDPDRIRERTGSPRPHNWILLCVASFLLLVMPHMSAQAGMTDKYDRQISKAMKRYLPVPYRVWGGELLKSQYYQESLLNPDARSHVGAVGIAQFMGPTWKDVRQELGLPVSALATNPKYAIIAGAYYMSKLRNTWKSKREEKDRYNLALASYNAGVGNILRAQRKTSGALEFQPIIDQLHLVTGIHAKETRTYVIRIWKIYKRLLT